MSGHDDRDAAQDLAEEVWTEDEPTAAEVDLMQRVLSSPWLAARDAAMRAEGREQVREAVEGWRAVWLLDVDHDAQAALSAALDATGGPA